MVQAGEQSPFPDGQWSLPMTRKEMALRLGVTLRGLKQLARRHPGLVLELYHTSYRIRLDWLDPTLRKRFEGLDQ